MRWTPSILTQPRLDMPSTRIWLTTIAKQGKIPEDLVKDVDGWVGKYLDYSLPRQGDRDAAEELRTRNDGAGARPSPFPGRPESAPLALHSS